MTWSLWLLFAGVLVVLGFCVLEHYRTQRALRRWISELEHRERSKGIEDQICWKWPVVK